MKPITMLAVALIGVATGANAQLLEVAGGSDAPASSKVEAPLTDAEVLKVDKAARELTLEHGDLPSLGMGPMTMTFSVSDPSMLEAVKVGDKVRFAAAIVDRKATVTKLETTR